jgi:hypothetical protein
MCGNDVRYTESNVYVQNLHRSVFASKVKDSGAKCRTSHFHADTNDRFVNKLTQGCYWP